MDEGNHVDDVDDNGGFFLLASFQQLLVQDNAWNANPIKTLKVALKSKTQKNATSLRHSAQLIAVSRNINFRIALVFVMDSFVDALTVQVCEYSSRKDDLWQKSFNDANWQIKPKLCMCVVSRAHGTLFRNQCTIAR